MRGGHDGRRLNRTQEWAAVADIDGPNRQKVARRFGLAHSEPGERRIMTATLEPARASELGFCRSMPQEIENRLHPPTSLTNRIPRTIGATGVGSRASLNGLATADTAVAHGPLVQTKSLAHRARILANAATE